MGNNTSKISYEEAIRPKNCYSCKGPLKWYQYMDFYKNVSLDEKARYNYAIGDKNDIGTVAFYVCGDCHANDSINSLIQNHKKCLELQQIEDLRISKFVLDKLHEWDVKNSYYDRQILVLDGENRGTPYRWEQIITIEEDKIVVRPNFHWKRREDKNELRFTYATEILGMDKRKYHKVCNIINEVSHLDILCLQGLNKPKIKNRWIQTETKSNDIYNTTYTYTKVVDDLLFSPPSYAPADSPPPYVSPRLTNF
jgi:hypothetical protein